MKDLQDQESRTLVPYTEYNVYTDKGFERYLA